MSDDLDRDEIYSDFTDAVNMAPKELEDWLETDESKSVGDSDGGESTCHRSGRRIVKIKRTKKDELSDDQLRHMKKVIGYVNRHLAQRPDGDVEDSAWRYSLMNWGHDPLKEDGS
jgi:predicted transglutaminase-like cysteine proteinase